LSLILSPCLANTFPGDSLIYVSNAGAKVKVNGEIKQLYNKGLDSAVVYVYQGANLISTTNTKYGRFNFELPLFTKLTIEIVRNNFYTKRITVDTNMPEGLSKSYYLAFDFIMVEKRLLQGLDDFFLDF